jgi:hypothetical protein
MPRLNPNIPDLPFPVLLTTQREEGARLTTSLVKDILAAAKEEGIHAEDLGVEDILPMTVRLPSIGQEITVEEFVRLSWQLQQQAYRGQQTSQTLVGHASTQQLWQQARWKMFGSRCYDLSAPLAATLLETAMNVDGSDIELPIPSFYLRVRDLGLTINNIETGDHILDGFYVSMLPTVGREYTAGDRELGEGSKAVAVMAVGLPNERSAEVTDNALASFIVLLEEGNVEDWVLKMAGSEGAIRGLASNAEHLVPWVRIIFGFCLYMLAEDHDEERRKLFSGNEEEIRAKARKLRERGKDKDAKRLIEDAALPVHYVRVGYKEQPSEELIRHASADEETRHLTRRFIVRGHYRNQPYGPGRAQRRIVFIRAFWKGPSWAEVVSARRHVVKNPVHEFSDEF